MKRDQRLLLVFTNYVLGPAFLIVGLLVTIFVIERKALPLASEVLTNGVTPEFGFVALLTIVPLIVAYVGLQLIRTKSVWRKPSGDDSQ